MVLEPGGLHNQLVTGTSSGELKFVDFRMVDSSGQMGVWKTVEAHTKGAMTAMAAHPYSPLLATATATQVHGHDCAHIRLARSQAVWHSLTLTWQHFVQLVSPTKCPSLYPCCTHVTMQYAGFEAVESTWRDAGCHSSNSALLSTARRTCQLLSFPPI